MRKTSTSAIAAAAPAPSGKRVRFRESALLGCLSLILVTALTSCSSASSAGSATSAPPVAASSAAPAAASSAASAAGITLTGFGATVDTWDSTRNPDTDFAGGAAYGADPSLPQINGHAGARYVTVQSAFDRVVSYQINFPPHVSITAALADILHTEFPADATYLWKRTVPGQCYQAEVKSATLAKALTGTQIGDGTGQVFLEAKTLPPGGTEGFDPANVTYANLGFNTINSAAGAPGC